jgi:hypothetical protein
VEDIVRAKTAEIALFNMLDAENKNGNKDGGKTSGKKGKKVKKGK